MKNIDKLWKLIYTKIVIIYYIYSYYGGVYLLNVFGREIIIDTKAGKILLESEVIKKSEYNWLKKLLEQNNKHTVKLNGMKLQK